ncbi:PREDICTED: uncharacterized protein LOC105556553 [Vollenhovia emeryi]|uniref:uncharacterized protein LOC105556553 n=1 Tax=Vollenhovia emeryi TaxID=411798 RepID=UPI0005F57959|nr:PREDICTED: uncharacterized protein LOC105556553 [Vollenhovia emeryi]
MLNERDRSSITNAIVHEMLKINYVPFQFEYAEIVKKICALFPSEDPAIYYIPPDKTHRNAQGKLPNKVKNIKHNLKKKGAGTLSSSPVQCTLEILKKSKIIEPAKLEGIINEEDHTIKTAIANLKHECRDSWPTLLMNWSVTHALRRKTLLETRSRVQCEANKGQEKDNDTNDESEDEEEQLVNEYIIKWDVLKLPNGYLLLNQDFKELFPGREDGLFSKWEIAKELIIELAETEISISDIFGRDLLKQYHTAPADKRDVITLYLLPSLCCKRGRGKSTGYIPSVQEARKFFIIHVTIPGDLRRAVKRHCAHLNAIGARLQPILIVVGQTLANITATYIQIDGIRYKLRTPVAALDACLKAYHALDAVYPQECKVVWYFVQHYFYNLYLKEDENISRVASLISSLKGLASKKE